MPIYKREHRSRKTLAVLREWWTMGDGDDPKERQATQDILALCAEITERAKNNFAPRTNTEPKK